MIEVNDTFNKIIKIYMRISLVIIIELLVITYSSILIIFFENVLIMFSFLLLALLGCSALIPFTPSYKDVINLINNNSIVIYTMLVITVFELLYFWIYPISENVIPTILIFLLFYKFCVFNFVLSFEGSVEKSDKEEQERNERIKNQLERSRKKGLK